MQTSYGCGRKTVRRRGKERKRRENGRQLVQLLLCLAVFLAVFIGKGVWPSRVAQTGEQLLSVIRANTDFRAAFAGLGQALSEQESVLGEIGEFCVSVFAPEQEEVPPAVPAAALEQENLSDQLDWNRFTAQKFDPEGLRADRLTQETGSVLQVGDVVQVTQQLEEGLPEGYSGQWLFLGEMETATPVLGTVTSQFGYRDHPTIGRYAAHGGADIAADKGESVAAFADGTVACVGENDDFGLYLQLDHANGVSTFYAHCDEICVRKGEQVAVGQTVARVGSTGQSTGPHLHFEVWLEGVRLDPMYYIDPGQGV